MSEYEESIDLTPGITWTNGQLVVLRQLAAKVMKERAEALAPLLALADEFDAQVPWPHSWIGNRIREAAGIDE